MESSIKDFEVAEELSPPEAAPPPRRRLNIIRVDKCDDVSLLASARIQDFDEDAIWPADKDDPEDEGPDEALQLLSLDDFDKIVWSLNSMEEQYLAQAQRWLQRAQMYANRRVKLLASAFGQRIICEALPIEEGKAYRQKRGIYSGGNYRNQRERAVQYSITDKEKAFAAGLAHTVQRPVTEIIKEAILGFRDKAKRLPGPDEGLASFVPADASYNPPKGVVTAVKEAEADGDN